MTHALALPEKYPLTSAHVSALLELQPWLKKNVKTSSAALMNWVAACREQLESLTERPPQEPADFRRAATIACKCADCAELKRFLQDPSEPVHRFSAAKDRRKHLEYQIRDAQCDLDLETDHRRSPHVLVCTKNKASYKKMLKTYHQNQEYLAAIRSIEESLPT
jgi:hypothetical protein